MVKVSENVFKPFEGATELGEAREGAMEWAENGVQFRVSADQVEEKEDVA